MQPIDPSGRYSVEVVTATLRGATGARTINFRYDRLDATNRYVAPVTNVLSASVAYDSLADIKGTAKFNLRDDGTINFLTDRIKPWIQLLMPDGQWVEWPQGVYVLSTPTRTLATTGGTYRDVEAYDQLVVLASDLMADRYTMPAGQDYRTAIYALIRGLGFLYYVDENSGAQRTNPTGTEWEPGTSRLKILNDLLSAINYRAAYFDQSGTLICAPYLSPDQQSPAFTYATDSQSVIVGDVTDSVDLYSVPNRWVLVVSNPEADPIVSSYTNTSPTSPTSTVSRGRTITDFRTEQDAADQASLDAKVARIAFEASQVFEAVELETLIMPMHGHADVLGVVVNGLSEPTAKFVEQSWSYDLKVGATMKHRVRRTVSVGPA